MIQKISENTLIPLGIAVIAIGGAATWLTAMKSKVDEHGILIEELRHSNEEHFKMVYEINSRLSRMEWANERFYEKK